MVETSRKRGPFDPRWPGPRRRGHLRLVPAQDVIGVDVAPGERPAVTQLPTFLPTEEEHDAPEEDTAWQGAAVLPLPTL